MGDSNDKSQNDPTPLPGSFLFWVTRIAGGSTAALVLICAIYVSFPYFEKQIQGRIDQCNQQITACVNDLKDARAELRETRADLRECKK